MEMLATGNLPGLTAPGEEARAVGYFTGACCFLQMRKKKSGRGSGSRATCGQP